MKKTSLDEYGKKLLITEDNKHLITALCYFLSNDEKFEDDLGYSFKKGILIRGVTGVGKTHLVRCCANNKIKPISIVSMLDLNDKAQKEGYFDLNFWNLFYFDDVGSEEVYVNSFGNRFSVFKNFIESYYLKGGPFNKMIFSTNNTSDELEEKYGYRVRSRLREMFNVIDLPGKDMR